jgi:hypothetical protein
MAKKTFKCPFCSRKYVLKDAVYEHMEKEHHDDLCGLPACQVWFNWNNGYPVTKATGKSVMSGRPTAFNVVSCRYERFADESERKQYREYFRQNMIKAFGKDSLLNDADQQKKMLAERGISGQYVWSDGSSKTTYTGSYERGFLEFVDLYMGWPRPDDIMAPAPMTFPYEGSDGKRHLHIPDFYISSLNMIVNVKSSGNKGYRLRDIAEERAEDEAIRKSKFNYVKVFDDDFEPFADAVQQIRDSDPKDAKRVFVDDPTI